MTIRSNIHHGKFYFFNGEIRIKYELDWCMCRPFLAIDPQVSGTSTSAPAVTDGTATLALVDVGQAKKGSFFAI